MKRLFLYLIFTLLIVVPLNVDAASSIKINCDKSEINAGGEINCTLSSTVDDNVSYDKLEANISIVGTSSITFKGTSGFEGSITDKKLTVTNTSSVGNTTIGTLNIKFSSDTTSSKILKLNNIKFYGEDSEVATANDVEATIKIVSNEAEAFLESLSVSECDSCKLSPSFSKDVTSYTVTTKSDQIRITAKGSEGSSVTGTGLKKLTKNEQVYKIIVNNSGNSITYKITVIKEVVADASLKSLSIDKGKLEPSFYSSNTNYTATVDGDKVVISATANDKNATVTGTGEKKLEYGKNSFTIVVTAVDGTTKSYLINITRPDTRNANAYLGELTIDGEDIGFEKDIIDYEYTVDSDITELEIEATPELKSSTIEIVGNEDFVVGENIVTITVTAEDGSEKVYTITVIKEDEEEETTGAYLDKLKISGYDIKFSKKKLEYTITIKDEKKLDITAKASEDYEVEITGNENLQDGSIIKIIVTDEEGNSNIYKIKIKVENKAEVAEEKEMNYIPIIMISLLGILAVVDIVLLIKKIKSKDK